MQQHNSNAISTNAKIGTGRDNSKPENKLHFYQAAEEPFITYNIPQKGNQNSIIATEQKFSLNGNT